jgi:UDP-N-acetylmuramoyl-tripeptide--D-alanyl-D-alanine ligase
VLLYDDTYNSSPAALLAAYAAFETAAAGRRKIAVVGEMLELGRRGPDLHREAGAALAGRFHHLVAVRGEAAALAGGARNAGAAESSVRIVDSVEAAIPVVAGLIRPGDAVFVKGSRGVRLDVLVDVLAGGAS